jgi:hypothetical protein
MEVSDQLHVPDALPHPGRSPVGLDAVEKGKSYTAGKLTREVQLVAHRYTDCAI